MSAMYHVLKIRSHLYTTEDLLEKKITNFLNAKTYRCSLINFHSSTCVKSIVLNLVSPNEFVRSPLRSSNPKI